MTSPQEEESSLEAYGVPKDIKKFTLGQVTHLISQMSGTNDAVITQDMASLVWKRGYDWRKDECVSIDGIYPGNAIYMDALARLDEIGKGLASKL